MNTQDEIDRERLGVSIESIRAELQDGHRRIYLGTRAELGLMRDNPTWVEKFDNELTTRCADATALALCVEYDTLENDSAVYLTADLTQDDVDACLEDDQVCPACRTEEIWEDGSDVQESQSIYRRMICNKCGLQYHLAYILRGVALEDEDGCIGDFRGKTSSTQEQLDSLQTLADYLEEVHLESVLGEYFPDCTYCAAIAKARVLLAREIGSKEEVE